MPHIKIKLLALATLLFWLPVVVFAKLAGEVHENKPVFFDVSILQWIHRQSTPFLDSFFLSVTTLANVEVIVPIAIVIVGYLWYIKRRSSAAIVFFSFIGAGAANFTLKLLFARTRPSFWESAVIETGYSFPSGHAMMSSALAFSLVAALWYTRARWWAVAFAVFFVPLVGVSRLYLGVHYPSDILAGWSASVIWVSIVAAIVYRKFASKKHHD